MASHSKDGVYTVTSDDDSDKNNEDFPHDEQFKQSMKHNDIRSFSSRSTYGQKEPTSQWSSAPKRSARKAPSTEPDPEFSNHPTFSAPSLSPVQDSMKNYNQSSTLEVSIGSQRVFGVPVLHPASVTSSNPQISDAAFLGHFKKQLPISRPPSASNSTAAGSDTTSMSAIDSRTSTMINEGSTSASSMYSSKSRFDDASERSIYRKFDNPTILREPERHFPLQDSDDIARVLESVTLNTKTTISSLDHLTAFSNMCRSGNPRSMLNERYQKTYKRSFTKKDFVTIRDTSDGDHVPTFTSLFLCPVTRDWFVSGDFLQGDFVQDRGGLKWYKKKATAEFAAAGRAEDCFRFRSGESHFGDQFCGEDPARSKEQAEKEMEIFLKSCDPKTRGNVMRATGVDFG